MQENQTPETTEQSPLDALSFEQYEHWRETGEMPTTEAADGQQRTEAESTGSDSGEQDVTPAEAETAEDKKEPSDESEQGKKRGGYQRKIDKLTREKDELARRLGEMERKLAPNGAAQAEQKPAAEAKPGKPQLDSFESYADYLEALTDWKEQEREEKRAQADMQRRQQEAQQQLVNRWQQKTDEARSKHDDFDEALESVPLPPPYVQHAILESEHSAEIAYHLAKNPAELDRIAKLTPFGAAREIGKIEAALTAAATKPAPKKTTSAPAPPTAVRGARTPATHTVYDDSLANDYGAWEKARNEQLRKR